MAGMDPGPGGGSPGGASSSRYFHHLLRPQQQQQQPSPLSPTSHVKMEHSKLTSPDNNNSPAGGDAAGGMSLYNLAGNVGNYQLPGDNFGGWGGGGGGAGGVRPPF